MIEGIILLSYAIFKVYVDPVSYFCLGLSRSFAQLRTVWPDSISRAITMLVTIRQH